LFEYKTISDWLAQPNQNLIRHA